MLRAVSLLFALTPPPIADSTGPHLRVEAEGVVVEAEEGGSELMVTLASGEHRVNPGCSVTSVLLLGDALHVGCAEGRVEVYDVDVDGPDGPIHSTSYEYSGPIRSLRLEKGELIASSIGLPDATGPEPPTGRGLFSGGLVLTISGGLTVLGGLTMVLVGSFSDVSAAPLGLFVGGIGLAPAAGGAVMLHYGAKRRQQHRWWASQRGLALTPSFGRSAGRTPIFGVATRF